jgi:hypothetical protein
MRYTVQYIPISKIKTDFYAKITQRVKELRKVAQDCIHLLIVREHRKKGGYIIINGYNNFEFLKNHTKKKFVPCLVDESKTASSLTSLVYRFRKRKPPFDVPNIKPDTIPLSSWSIINTFLKKEPRFKRLSLNQQIRIIRIGIQYKRTTVLSMKAKVDDLLKK